MPNDKSSSRPKPVKTAVMILFAMLGVAVLNVAYELARGTMLPESVQQQTGVVLVALGMSAFVFLLMGVLNLMIHLGYNWARITFTVLFLIGVPMTLYNGVTQYAEHPTRYLISMVQTLAQGYAIYLLFRPESSAWFKRPRGHA